MDSYVFKIIQNFRNPWLDEFMRLVTVLGDWKLLLQLSALITFGLFFRDRGRALKLFLAIYGGAIIILLIKYSVQRMRPFPDLALVQEIGFSFPSAHAFFSLVFYGFFIHFLCHSQVRPEWKWVGGAGLALLILIIGFSRIYLGVHWTSDVVGGMLLGICWFAAIYSAK